MQKRRAFNNTYLETWITDNNVIIDRDYIKDKKVNRDIEIKGNCITENCDGIFLQYFRALTDGTGPYCENCIASNAQLKREKTCLLHHGVKSPLQSEKFKKKCKETNLKIYGVECSMQNEQVKQKCRETTLKNHGVEHSLSSKEVREKGKITMIAKYGVPMHVPEIAEKCSKSAYSFYDYEFPSGRKDRIQGYENFALDELLLTGIHEDDIITKRTEVPEVWWFDDEGKEHRYYTDAYVKSLKLAIETKSTWTI